MPVRSFFSKPKLDIVFVEKYEKGLNERTKTNSNNIIKRFWLTILPSPDHHLDQLTHDQKPWWSRFLNIVSSAFATQNTKKK